jgi:hypothetical protein
MERFSRIPGGKDTVSGFGFFGQPVEESGSIPSIAPATEGSVAGAAGATDLGRGHWFGVSHRQIPHLSFGRTEMIIGLAD